MKLRAAIAKHESSVEIRREGARTVAEVDQHRYDLDLHESGVGSYVVMVDGRVFACRINGHPESGKPVDVIVGAETFTVTLTDLKRLRGSANITGHGHEAARIVAPMPGKVVRLLVEVGAEIQAGAGIVTVEAMKMQNEMKSPKAGTVVAVNVEAGATVNAGDVLAVIE